MKTAELEVALHWTEVDKIPVLRLWQDPDQYPQTAVMTVSHSEYLEFSKDPIGFMKYVNSNHVFGKPVIFAGPWVSLSSVGQEKEQSGWLLTLVHGKKSTMIVSALPQLNEEDEKSKWFSCSGHLSSIVG